MINSDWVGMVVFLLACAIHEAAHIFHYRYIKREYPKVTYNLLGVFPQITDQLTIIDKLVNILLAITIGLIPIMIYGEPFLYLVYGVTLLIDIFLVVCLIISGIKYGFRSELSQI